MGVEPTSACSAQPPAGFEDRGIHRDTSTPSRRHYNPPRPQGLRANGDKPCLPPGFIAMMKPESNERSA